MDDSFNVIFLQSIRNKIYIMNVPFHQYCSFRNRFCMTGGQIVKNNRCEAAGRQKGSHGVGADVSVTAGD